MVTLRAATSALTRAYGSGALPALLLGLLPVPVLLLADVLHAAGVPAFGSPRWSVEVDRSWFEVWGYALVAVAVVVLLVVAASDRGAPVHAAWAAGLAVLVLDDALTWHESGGEWLDRRLPLPDPPGLRTQDVGELAVWAGLGAVVLLLLWSQHRRSAAAARRDSWCLAGWVVLLAVFAVGVDMLHITVQQVTWSVPLHRLVGRVEAAGQLVAMAGLLAQAVHIACRPDPASARPGDLVSSAQR